MEEIKEIVNDLIKDKKSIDMDYKLAKEEARRTVEEIKSYRQRMAKRKEEAQKYIDELGRMQINSVGCYL